MPLAICCVQHTYFAIMSCAQDGTDANEWWEDTANGLNSTFVVVGHSLGNWAGTKAGELGDMDFIAAKLDIHGNVLWRWQVNSGKQTRT